MTDCTLDIQVSLAALQAVPLRKLQRLVDMVQFSRAGAVLVTDDHYPKLDFVAISPSTNTRLTLPDARDATLAWLVRHGLRDGIEAVSLSLEDSRRVAALYILAAKGQIKVAEFDAVFAKNKWFHRLGLPHKMNFLKNTYHLSSDFDTHLLSLNLARNCIVHRDGIVTELDLNDGDMLTLTFLKIGLAAVAPNGESRPITEPQVLEGGSTVQVSIGPTKRTFAVGERMLLTYDELIGAFLSLQQYINTIASSLQTFGESLGLKFPETQLNSRGHS